MEDSLSNVSGGGVMDEPSRPLVDFFKAILEEMKKRMPAAEFADLLKGFQEVKEG